MKFVNQVACLFFLVSISFANSLWPQGFGLFQSKHVSINRVLPPVVNLNGKRITIETSADSLQNNGEAIKNLLKTKLVTKIQQDPRFILNDAAPETILHFTVTNFYTEKWIVAQGTDHQSASYRGKLEVSFQAIDSISKVALDSENLSEVAGFDPVSSPSFSEILHTNKKKEAAEKSDNETRDQLVDSIVSDMSRRIAPFDEPFDAPLPGKKLEPLSSLAMSDRWGALQEQAEKADPLLKPEDDTYRKYLIGIALEAQAYALTKDVNEQATGKRTDISAQQAEDEFVQAQKKLDAAAAIYKDIIKTNPKEKEFRSGDTRTEEALSIYARIAKFKEEAHKAELARQNMAQNAAGSATPNGHAPQTQTPLDQVLDFCSQGMAVDSIKEYIESGEFMDAAKATAYKFSFARDASRLHDVCKNNAAVLQKAIRDRLAAAPAAAAPAATTKKAAPRSK